MKTYGLENTSDAAEDTRLGAPPKPCKIVLYFESGIQPDASNFQGIQRTLSLKVTTVSQGGEELTGTLPLLLKKKKLSAKQLGKQKLTSVNLFAFPELS